MEYEFRVIVECDEDEHAEWFKDFIYDLNEDKENKTPHVVDVTYDKATLKVSVKE